MIRLPPTSIDISQSDLQAQLQHLDFVSGLLKQGFKKHEIAKYLRQRNVGSKELLVGSSSSLVSGCPPSTYALLSHSSKSEDELASLHSTHAETTKASAQFASPIRSPDPSIASPQHSPDEQTATFSVNATVERKTYAPRHSSLLRFTRAISSDASDKAVSANLHFSPRSKITYRPRSETYSYDQSELDEEDFVTRCSTPNDKVGSSSSDDLITGTDSTRTTLRIGSSLRPDALPFTPFHARSARPDDPRQATDDSTTQSSNSSSPSIPSSPPALRQLPSSSDHASPSLPPAPQTPTPARNHRVPSTVQPQSQQHFLDGSFTVYDDSVPARLQPQTPAELGRGQYLTQYNAAYTAPPGMVRSSATRQHTNFTRQASGELSPTAQATLIRARRQREFIRGLRVEGQRIDRSHANARQTASGSGTGVDQLNFWREDLDADGVGEENFEEASLSSMLRGMRVVSGNRRAA